MRILQVTDFYSPYVGGVEQHVRSLAHGLADRGHVVAVATTATSQAPAGRDADGPVLVERIPTTSARLAGAHADGDRPWAPPVPDPEAARALRSLIRSWRPDVVHGHDWLGRSAALWCGSGGPPYVESQHYYTRSCARKDRWRDGARCAGPAFARCVGCAADTYGRARAVPVVVATRLGARWSDRRSRATIAVSEATARGNDTPAGYAVIPNMLAPAGARPGADDPLPTLPDGPFALFVGDLRDTKGFFVLLEAWATLQDPLPLVVVGERVAATPPTLPDGVWELGTVPNGVVARLQERAAFTVVPSVWAEPFGIVAIEAMRAGTPVIVADSGGLGELVDHERTGLVVPAGDVAALAGAVERLAHDPELRHRLGDAGLDAVERFTTDRVVGAVEAVYQGVRARGAGR